MQINGLSQRRPARKPAACRPFPQSLRPSPAFVRPLRRYYAAVRLPAAVHVGLIAHRLLPPIRSLPAADGNGVSRFSRVKFPCMHGVYDSAEPAAHSRLRAPPCCLPYCVTPSAPWISRFRSSSTSGIPSLHMPLSNASSAASRPPSHGSGSGWFATPFLYDSFIHYFTPVYPDAIHAECVRHVRVVITLAIAVNMRFAAIAALLVCSLGAEPWPLERLFSRPFAWGTTPGEGAMV